MMRRLAELAVAQRKWNALADLAERAERTFHQEAVTQRVGWREAARQPCEDALDDALVALNTLAEEAEQLSGLNGVWSWLTKARDLNGVPRGDRAANVPIREVRAALQELAPVSTEERWAAEEAKQQELHEELQNERSRRGVSFRTRAIWT